MTILKRLNLISFLSSLLFYTPIFALYFTENGVLISHIIIGQTLYSVISMIAEVPTGYLADRIGQRNSAIFSYLSGAIGLGLALLFPNIWGVLLAFSFRGIGSAFESGSEEVIVYEEAKRTNTSFTQAWGIFNSYSTIGFAVATFIAGLLAQYIESPLNFSVIFLASIASYTLAALLMLTLKKDEYSQEDTPSFISSTLKSFSTIKNNRTIFALMITIILTYNAQWVLYDAYQPHMIENGVSLFFLGFSLTLGLLLQSILLRSIGWLEKNFGLIPIILMVNIPVGLLYIFFALSSHPVMLVVIFVLMQGLFGLHRPIISDFINSHLKSELRSTSLSAVSFLNELAKIVLKLGVGALFAFLVMESAFIWIGIYILVGTLVSGWNLKRCGCAYRFEEYIEK